MEDALKIMAAKSPEAGRSALECLRALDVKSPVLQHRYNHCVEMAFGDSNAWFTPAERQIIAGYVSGVTEEARGMDIRVRVNQREKSTVQKMAEAEGMTVSDFIRERIGI